jgi:predicted nucleic acid-binding protein
MGFKIENKAKFKIEMNFMGRYLIDTNVLISYLRRDKKAISFLDSLEKVVISTISAGEIYQGVRNKKELRLTKDFLSTYCRIISLDEQISGLSLELLEKYILSRGLLLLDALIAATAIKYDLTLITSNSKHFEIIKELKVEKW